MARVQLALNVGDLDRAVEFYSKLFGTAPAKVRPGYANFAIEDPPLKLVLIEQPRSGTELLNHLGVEVETAGDLVAARSRLDAAGLTTDVEDATACCYAVQDKVWVDNPDDEPWEFYTVRSDVEMTPGSLRAIDPSAPRCCATRPDVRRVGPTTPCC